MSAGDVVGIEVLAIGGNGAMEGAISVPGGKPGLSKRGLTHGVKGGRGGVLQLRVHDEHHAEFEQGHYKPWEMEPKGAGRVWDWHKACAQPGATIAQQALSTKRDASQV